MKSKYNRESEYTQIINARLGKNFTYKTELIKDEQCTTCRKKKQNDCRLNIINERCVNYESKSIRKI